MGYSEIIDQLTHQSLSELIGNRIAAVKLNDFATKSEVDSFAQALIRHTCRTKSVGQVTRLGISQYQQGVCVNKQSYFDMAREVSESFEQVFAQSFSPLQRIIDRLKQVGFDAAIMHEPGYGDYFAGNGKLRNGFSPIHVDFAPQDSKDWLIGASKAQLAWNFYLQVPAQGGELLLWNKLWQPADDIYQVKDSYYYDERVVQDVPLLKLKVSPGEVFIINSRNFHAVAESNNRLAYGSFISVFDDDSLRFWS